MLLAGWCAAQEWVQGIWVFALCGSDTCNPSQVHLDCQYSIREEGMEKVYSFARAAITKSHRPGGSNHRYLIPLGPRGWEADI